MPTREARGRRRPALGPWVKTNPLRMRGEYARRTRPMRQPALSIMIFALRVVRPMTRGTTQRATRGGCFGGGSTGGG
jgi:hypothetical protein